MNAARPWASKVSALISDVDGTLVTDDKVLTERTRRAVVRLRAVGVEFAIISSRPPHGLRMLVDPLGLRTPIAGFNGGMLVTAAMSTIDELLLPVDVATRAVEAMAACGVHVWVFTAHDWLLRDPDGPYVGLEEHTVRFPPTIVDDFGRSLDAAAKIVGVSDDFDLLARCDAELRRILARKATVARSQPYYLDVTHPDANKGAALLKLAQLLAIPAQQIAVIGDGHNDIAMFREAGLSIAMGNAAAEVQHAADFVTDSNADEGFANAVERVVLAVRPPTANERMPPIGRGQPAEMPPG